MKCEYCDGCKHYRLFGGGRGSECGCHYLLDMYKHRDCPFGDGCKYHTEKTSREGDAGT